MLSDVKIRNAQKRTKPYKLTDEKGLSRSSPPTAPAPGDLIIGSRASARHTTIVLAGR
jgi:hypothetical protein